jgi:lipopolysaccharide export LptBFGC system permease protein LptF
VLAYVAAAFCAIAAVFSVMNVRFGPITTGFLVAVALTFLCLHVAGAGDRLKVRR